MQIFPLQHEPKITGTNQIHNSCRNMTSFSPAILLIEYVKLGNFGCIKNGFLCPAILLLECVSKPGISECNSFLGICVAVYLQSFRVLVFWSFWVLVHLGDCVSIGCSAVSNAVWLEESPAHEERSSSFCFLPLVELLMEREERVFNSFCDRIVHMGLQEEDEELVQQAFRRVLWCIKSS